MPSRNILQANPMSAPRAMTDRSKTPAEPTTAQRPKRAPNAKPNAKPAKKPKPFEPTPHWTQLRSQENPDAKPAKRPATEIVSEQRKRAGRGIEHVPTDETREMVVNLAFAGIPQERIAACLSISHDTLSRHYAHEIGPAVDNLLAECVYAGLTQRARMGDVTAAIWLTKSRLRWSEKQDITISGGEKPLEVSVQSQLVERLVASIEGRRANRKPDA
jgi:hypothetical protein